MVAEDSRPRAQGHADPCAHVVQARAMIDGLVEDRKRLNGSIVQMNDYIGELHEKVNCFALLQEKRFGTLETQVAGLASAKDLAAVKQDVADIRLEMQRTLGNAGWKVLGAMMTAGLGLGSALTMFVLNRLVP